MESKFVVKIDTYESNNKTITLNNIYYDYVKGIIYQINKDKVNVYKPRNDSRKAVVEINTDDNTDDNKKSSKSLYQSISDYFWPKGTT